MQVKVLSDILEANDTIAEQNRERLAAGKVCAINLMSGPGAGKTSLLERTLEAVAGTYRAGVIEGDIETSLDAGRLARFRQRRNRGAGYLGGRRDLADPSALLEGS